MEGPGFVWIPPRKQPAPPAPSLLGDMPPPPPPPSEKSGSESDCKQLAIPVGTISLNNETLFITNSGIYLVGCDKNQNLSRSDQLSSDSLEDYLNSKDIASPISGSELQQKTEADNDDTDSYYSMRSPFYGSVAPVIYTLAGATVLGWLLLILLIISTKKRPWLQKFSTLALAALLTATLAQAFNELDNQYAAGYQDSFELQKATLGALSFEIPAVIVQAIMWLAHIQIVLRIFGPRKEVLMVKIVGGILLILEIIFWSIGLFVDRNRSLNATRLHENQWIIVAYAFEIVFVTVYAVCMLAYSLRKARYAYNDRTYIIALFSTATLVAPLVFIGLFSSRWIIGWAVYCVYISNGAATVVLWDWLDAIELYEKQEQRNGIMGRQVYEDEMALEFKSKLVTQFRGSNSTDNGGDSVTSSSDPGSKAKIKGWVVAKIKSPLLDFSWTKWQHIFRVGASPASLWTNYNSTRRMQTSDVDLSEMQGTDNSGANNYAGFSNEDGTRRKASGQIGGDDISLSPSQSPGMGFPTPQPDLTTVITIDDRLQRFIHPVKQSSSVLRASGLSVGENAFVNSPQGQMNAREGYHNASNSISNVNRINDVSNMNNMNHNMNAIINNNENIDDDDSDDDDLYVVVQRNDEAPSQLANQHVYSHDTQGDDDEEPPNVFNRIPGFDPGDYWDDKAPSSSHRQ
ncbi:Rim21p [Sugiyamaella lignohabitans]|uniref:pH-response regulator protein palH/RIM21 n=1 Tax=Sugiyamaella lignohabitans TaxID=796027 RepID=A0A167EN16_9ASCO|nr:Rim21p [Sugiyamaella lignohabitans]ANB14271.1 Rim21p [Sugiyamaella lignohabitans]